MTLTSSSPALSPWMLRRARAAQLLDKTPHSGEMLSFYVGLVGLQERVADGVPLDDWVPLVQVRDGSAVLLAVDRLPVNELVHRFDDFLKRIAEVGTEIIMDGARSLLGADDAHRSGRLDAALTAGLTTFGLTAAEPTGFHVRAFLEPLVTTLAAAFVEAPSDEDRRQCFACSSLPQISVLRDRPDAVGSRSLVCSMCATEWRFPRLTCTHCGETTANRLPVHTAESVPHVRIDTCLTCQRYLKSVDLRLQGDAVPIVDDVATVELDLWAENQGLTKIRTNVLGF